MIGLFIHSTNTYVPSTVTGTGDTKTKRTQTLTPQLDAGDRPPGERSRKVSSEPSPTSVQGSGVSKEVGSLWAVKKRLSRRGSKGKSSSMQGAGTGFEGLG